MAIQTPSMFLYLPTIGVDSGLVWETDLNANSQIIDMHNHSVGSGVQINPAGIFINADLTFNGFNAISLRSTRYVPQLAPLTGPLDLGCVYVSGVDLYYNAVNGGPPIQITKGGTVFASSNGISSGTATASFVGSTLVVNSASNTPANIQGGSYIMGNPGVSGGFYVTLQAPAALAGNYTLTFPLDPPGVATQVMTLTPAGVMSSITYDQVGVNMTFVGANAIAASINSVGANSIISKFTTISGSQATIIADAIPAGTLTGMQLVTNANFPGDSVQENGKNIIVSQTNASVSLAIVRGRVDGASSTPVGGEGFSSSFAVNPGVYQIVFTTAFADVPLIAATPELQSFNDITCALSSQTTAGFQLTLWSSTGGGTVNNSFNFIAIGKRNP